VFEHPWRDENREDKGKLYSFGGMVIAWHASPLRVVADNGSGAGRGCGGRIRVGYRWQIGWKGGCMELGGMTGIGGLRGNGLCSKKGGILGEFLVVGCLYVLGWYLGEKAEERSLMLSSSSMSSSIASVIEFVILSLTLLQER
jgi:hypothetical protein